MGKAGLVLGIIGLVVSLIPFWGAFVTIPCVAVGLPLSGSAFYQARKSGTGSGVAIAGWVTGVVAIVFSSGVGTFILWYVIIPFFGWGQ